MNEPKHFIFFVYRDTPLVGDMDFQGVVRADTLEQALTLSAEYTKANFVDEFCLRVHPLVPPEGREGAFVADLDTALAVRHDADGMTMLVADNDGVYRGAV